MNWKENKRFDKLKIKFTNKFRQFSPILLFYSQSKLKVVVK